MNQAHLEDVRGLFTFNDQGELDAKQEAFSKLDMSAQIFALGVLVVAALDAAYVIGETLDPSNQADATPEPQADAAPAPELPPRRLSLSSSVNAPTAPASEASTNAPAAPASEASTNAPAAAASAPFEVS